MACSSVKKIYIPKKRQKQNLNGFSRKESLKNAAEGLPRLTEAWTPFADAWKIPKTTCLSVWICETGSFFLNDPFFYPFQNVNKVQLDFIQLHFDTIKASLFFFFWRYSHSLSLSLKSNIT